MENTQQNKTDWNAFYNKWYKVMLIPPVVLFILCLVYLFSFHAKNNDFIYKDSGLSGGTTVTINLDVDSGSLEDFLKQKFSDVYVRTINDISTGRHIAVIVDSSQEPEVMTEAIEEHLGLELTEENSSVEFSGASLGSNFYKQLLIAIIISFVLMSIVVFVMFRTFIPAIAVIFAALADIIFAVAAINLLGVRLSAAGIAAFLMLIGYAVDDNILLTSRVIKKRSGTINHRIYGAFKTGIFMSMTALLAVLPAFFIITGLPDSFRQIFLILSVGLVADIINTWLANASIIKWYAEIKKL